jgi:hypothetical protein
LTGSWLDLSKKGQTLGHNLFSLISLGVINEWLGILKGNGCGFGFESFPLKGLDKERLLDKFRRAKLKEGMVL